MQKSRALSFLENAGERFLFASRWLLAPVYIGMVLALIAIVVKFFQKLWDLFSTLLTADSDQLVLGVLALLDLALLANLVLIVIFAGYETFVSKIRVARGSEDRPHWMGHVDFSGLKMKLIGSIVAISVIGLLHDFTLLTDEEGLAHFDPVIEFWRLMLHLTFVISGVLFSVMDWLGEKRVVISQQTHRDRDSDHSHEHEHAKDHKG
jgi:uncharacterized protein (TIGR00645 family)